MLRLYLNFDENAGRFPRREEYGIKEMKEVDGVL